ncbi:GbsR/MarR family transcriptional regulator [Psychroflexus halocasei]|uniref:DNA-binding transcriptional regulator GbsR, MarR family n=1 Tax=Psychroflexus halocasei TaxID=908615 RepID=A0A1H3YT09_9FLAO|nr:hypothetical protein [Psychroflexus halocasei]SEA14208.1 hypothetical protein SAMN05421540_103236 [Psychroflexus halocasei]
MNQQLEERRSVLIEKLGVFFEKEHHLAPVAARIFSLIILSGKKGVTFEELVCRLKAGESTVSTHLESLQLHNKIEYFTLVGDRKRYFIVNKDLMLNSLDELQKQWTEQKSLFQEVLSFKKECMAEDESGEENFDLQFQKNFIAYADDILQSISKLKSKIK